jgi:hypothetical protein
VAKFHTLQNDFSAPTLSAAFATDGANVVYGSGVVTLGIFTAQNNLKTAAAWDLTSSLVLSRVSFPPTGGGGHQCSFRLATGSPTNTNNEIRFFRNGANAIDCRYAVGGVLTTLVTLTYDPAAHAWMRLRHTGATVFWEFSADGLVWSVAASESTAVITWDLTNVFLRITGVMFGAETGVVVVDSINYTGAKAPRIGPGVRTSVGSRPGSRPGPQVLPGRRTAPTIQGGA